MVIFRVFFYVYQRVDDDFVLKPIATTMLISHDFRTPQVSNPLGDHDFPYSNMATTEDIP